MKKSVGLESLFLFLSLAVLIPIPRSTPDQHRHMLPLMVVCSLFFFASRAIRHGVLAKGSRKIAPAELAYAIAESVIFGIILMVARLAAGLG